MLAAENFPRHGAKVERRKIIIFLKENCLEEKLRHRFYAIFDLVGPFYKFVIFFDTGQLAAQRFRITLLAYIS